MYISNLQTDVPIFSLYPNVKGNNKIKDISLTELKGILTNHPQKDLIEEYRSTGIDSLKKSILTLTPHGIFSEGQKSDTSLSSLNGLIFLDFDDSKSNTRFILEGINEIVCFWDSVSGQGIHALAILDGVTAENHKDNHIAYLNYLELVYGLVADKKVCNLSTGLIIGTNPTFRSNPIALLIDELGEFRKMQVNSNIDPEEVLLLTCIFSDGGTKMLFKSELSEYTNSYMYFEEGLPYFSCYLPFDNRGISKKIESGSRNTILSGFLNNLILLNPNKTKEDFNKVMLSINKNHCLNPLPDNEIIKMVESKIANRSSLKPIGVKLKKYWIDPNANNKRDLFQKARRDRTQDIINQYFSDELLNETSKITIKGISERIKISQPTLREYLTDDQKKLIKEFNKSLKNAS